MKCTIRWMSEHANILYFPEYSDDLKAEERFFDFDFQLPRKLAVSDPGVIWNMPLYPNTS